MRGDFAKFPTTPHLVWLGKAVARADKVLTRAEAESFLRQPVVVEEKVDGANLGIGFDAQGNLFAQNRGNMVQQGTKGQFARLGAWLSEHEVHLLDAFEDRFILFGEWCYARHSIHYTRLSDFFLAFDVFDRRERRFMSTPRRNELAAELKIATVPTVGDGSFGLAEVLQRIGQSSLYEGPMEGIYLRQEDTSWLLQRAKVVRAEFVQQIGEHWSKHAVVPNRLKSADLTIRHA